MSNEEAIYIINHLYSDNHIIYDKELNEICISSKFAKALEKAKESLSKEVSNNE